MDREKFWKGATSPVDLNSYSFVLPIIPDTKVQSSCQQPSDEQSLLASQAEDMASILKSDIPSSALSERLCKFAKDVAMLEERASEYQAVIQRQQVQLQHLSEVSSPRIATQLREEIKSLKEENETLHAYINTNTQRQPLQISQRTSEIEHGWITVANNTDTNTETTSMLQYPDSPLMKRIDSLQIINAKLFKANKDWHTKWESLRQSKQQEKEELQSHLKITEESRDKLKDEVASLTNLLQEEKTRRRRCEADMEHQKSQVDSFKSDIMRQQSEIASLKGKGEPSQARQKEDAQISLLKQQLTVFMQDFEKEKKEKRLYAEKLRRHEKEHDQLKLKYEQKLKSLQAELRLKDDKLKLKTKDVDKLQFRVSELVEELERQKHLAKTPAAAESYIVQSPSSSVTSMASLVYPSGAGPRLSSISSSNFAIGGRRSPEKLPGAWTCQNCTYINYPDRTICDICGFIKSFEAGYSLSSFEELQSRGSPPDSIGRNVPDRCSDVETDSI